MLNKLRLGWIDYSNEHRNRVMAVLDTLTEPEAIDEIGIGTIRDGFANILFPGTSTIQTRAKYFFLIPYILMELEKEVKIDKPKKLLQKLNEIEIELIGLLNKDGAEGVIGRRAGQKLKRKPSSIYWNGLRTYGMLKYSNLSLDGYAKAVCSIKDDKRSILSHGHNETDLASDDSDAYQGEISGGFWRSLPPQPNWKENISIELTKEEAYYLKERIIKAPQSKDSLFAFLLKKDYTEKLVHTNYQEIGTLVDLPESIRRDYDLARRFAEFIYGASVRYNVILSNGKNQKAQERWEKWRNSVFVKNEFEMFDFYEVINRLELENGKLVRFLRRWKEQVLSGDLSSLDELIIEREIELKSRERAKLNNSKVYIYQDGHWVGNEDKLQYRLRNTKQLISDIYKGLEV
ncbi:hypothetical protein DMN50_15850 [Priestia megaterium]|nr:hypothetical protein DMN50_15850 [Priestia megaterium]